MTDHPSRQALGLTEEKKIEKIVTSDISRRPRPLGKRLKESFIADGAETVGSYVMMNVVLPNVKDLLAEMARVAVEKTLYGSAQTGRRPSSNPGSTSRISYNKVGSSSIRQDPRSPRANRVDFEDVVFANREEADSVQEAMYELLKTYEFVLVSDLNELIGVRGQTIDSKWGWRSLRGSSVIREGSSFVLTLPKPQPIN